MTTCTRLDMVDNSLSNRRAKFNALIAELQFWGYADMHPETREVMRIISGELSWRMMMRIIHKLRRMRGAEA